MSVLKELLRKWRAKGHGIHSPFAFRLITGVLYSPYAYNAFSDIEDLLSQNNISPEGIGEFHHLLFRLIHHLKPENILEIGAGKGFGTLFLAAAHPRASITCIENNAGDVVVAKKLLHQYPNSVTFKKTYEQDDKTTYDAVIIHTTNGYTPDKQTLFSLSRHNTFWLFHPTRQPGVKPLLRNIVKDKRVRVVFDMKQTNLLFLNPSYHKTAYYI